MSATDRSELDGYEALVSELRANPPLAPERLRQRVLELAPGARPRMSRRRRLVLVVVPVTVALAVGAALVHGFVSSGSHPAGQAAKQAAKRLATLHGAANTPAAAGPATTTPSADERLLTPAHKLTTQAGAPVFGKTQLSPAAPQSLTIPKNRLVHAAASLQVQVADHAALSRATNRATQIVASLGGYAQSVHYESSGHRYGSALLALRVPVGKAQVAISRLENLGTLLSQQLSTKDLQQQLTQQTNQIGSLRRAIAVYEQALQSRTLSASERVDIQIKLANARHAITAERKARTGTLASGATSDISLTLTTRGHAVVGTHRKSGRFDRLLGSAGDFLALEGIIVLYALIVAGPLVVLGGLAWWLARERRRRDERRLLASA
jgi:Domain of unknown function (DUF4349)